MPSSSSCVRCQRLLTADSPSGMCPVCERTTGGGQADRTAGLAGPELERTSLEPPFAATARPTHAAPTRGFPADAVLAPESHDWIVRRLPPGYDPLEVLGQGGMGLVVKAWERDAERVVAIKLIRTLPDREAIERFRIEAKALASLKHPNLVQVLTVAVDSPDPYFTMEYVEGGGLDRSLKKSGPLPVAEAMRVIEASARGIAAAHAAGVIHRDLKPANVLLAADGTPKVTDFGLAKRRDRDPDLTVSGALVGTPNYMAPEQAGRRKLPVTESADVYSLGATLYHLLTGKPPFRGNTQHETLHNVLTTQPVPPRKHRPDLPAALEAVVLKCLEKDPEDRYDSALSLADDLARVQRGEPPQGPARWPAKAWRRARRNWPVAAGVLVLAVLLALAAPFVRDLTSGPKGTESVSQKVIIPSSGVPVRLNENWILGKTHLYASADTFNACAIAPAKDALLAVTRDPGRDRYAIDFDLCMLRTRMAPANAGKLPEIEEVAVRNVGIFFGHSHLAGADGSDAHTFMGTQLTDYLPEKVNNVGITEGIVKLDAVLIHDRAEKRQHWTGGASPPVRFPPSPSLPAQWRRLRLEVTPERVKVFWAVRPGADLELLANLTAQELQQHYAHMQDWFDRYAPEAKYSVVGWNPRQPVGIWSRGAGVAVCNVILHPLP